MAGTLGRQGFGIVKAHLLEGTGLGPINSSKGFLALPTWDWIGPHSNQTFPGEKEIWRGLRKVKGGDIICSRGFPHFLFRAGIKGRAKSLF